MINLNPMIANALKGALDDETGVELPFPAPLLYVKNGQPAYKQLNNAQYFGGWAADAEKMEEAIDEGGKTFPLSLASATESKKDGEEYKIYCARAVVVAPVGRRISWVTESNGDVKRSTKYGKGSRMHIQLLAYMAEKKEKAIVPWGPVVLSAKGIQAGNVLGAFREWSKASKEIRKKCANALDAAWFYLPIGTFGERQVKEVGKATKNSITPIRAYIPEAVDEAYLTRMFVGADVAAEMAGYKTQAAEWLNAWKEPEAAAPGDVPLDPGEEQGDEEAF